MIDHQYDGRGVSASIIDGGLNSNHTKVLLKSQPGARINVTLLILSSQIPPFSTFSYQKETPYGWTASTYSNQIRNSQNPPSQQNNPFPWPFAM